MERKPTIQELEKAAQETEKNFPEVEVEAICTGSFLADRNYHRIGNDGFFKRETDKRYYTFFAVEETKDPAISSSHLHPFYRLEHIS